MSRNDPIGVARAVALYWNLVPQDARHDLLIHCLSHTTTAGCIDALVAAYDEREIGEIVAKLTALHCYLKGGGLADTQQELDRSGAPNEGVKNALDARRAIWFGSCEQKLDHSGWPEHIRRTIR